MAADTDTPPEIICRTFIIRVGWLGLLFCFWACCFVFLASNGL